MRFPPKHMENRAAATPVIPLPNPGEGGPVFDDFDNDASATPVIPLPNPGEGGPVFDAGNSGLTGGSGNSGNTIVIQPLPGTIVSVPGSYAAVRFLNATYGYPAFRIFIDGVRAVTLLNTGSASGYVRIPAGTRRISVRGQDGYVYIEQPLTFVAQTTSTVAIINRAGGLSLTQIGDACRVI